MSAQLQQLQQREDATNSIDNIPKAQTSQVRQRRTALFMRESHLTEGHTRQVKQEAKRTQQTVNVEDLAGPERGMTG